MTPTKMLECIRDKDGLHSNAASYEAPFVQALAKEILELRADNERLREQIEEAIETGTGAAKAANLCGSQLIQADADVRMWKGNYEAAEQHVTILRTQLADNEKRWLETFEKRVSREHEMIDEAIDGFIDRVLGILREVGMPTEDCDGEESPETILSGWIIANWMHAGHKIKELEQDKCGLAADALNARQLLREFMAYVKCGQVPEDAHCVRRAKQLLASELLGARAREGGGGGGFVNLPPAEEKYNVPDQRPGAKTQD